MKQSIKAWFNFDIHITFTVIIGIEKYFSQTSSLNILIYEYKHKVCNDWPRNKNSWTVTALKWGYLEVKYVNVPTLKKKKNIFFTIHAYFLD